MLLGFYTLSFYDIRQLSDPLQDALNGEVQLGSHTVSWAEGLNKTLLALFKDQEMRVKAGKKMFLKKLMSALE